MINSMEQLEPFGMGYPEPKILIKKVSSVYSKIIGKIKLIYLVLWKIFMDIA